MPTEHKSWWLEPDFRTNLQRFNAMRKVFGESDLPPVVRDILTKIELCDYHEQSEIPTRRPHPKPSV